MNQMDEWLKNAKAQTAAKKKAERAARPKGQKCSTCLHHRGHAFSEKYHYCKKGTSKHTPNGFAKTTAGGWGSMWESQPKPQ
jgi:hypothetical protein